MKLYNIYKSLFDKYQINTSLRIAHFMSQIEHESGLKPISENLNYSKEGLLKTFPNYFTKDTVGKDKKIIPGTASQYHRQPEKIANKVYANRMGNGDENSGDGWKYRGRYFIQVTGKNNYVELQNDTGINYLDNPDSRLNEADSLIAALWFWNKHKLNKLADRDDLDAISDLINLGHDTFKEGDSNGYIHRKDLLAKYKKELL